MGTGANMLTLFKRLLICFCISLFLVNYGNAGIPPTFIYEDGIKEGVAFKQNYQTGLTVTMSGITANISSKAAAPGTVTICASNATSPNSCDYVCDGTDDDVQIQAAVDDIAASSANYGVIKLSEGAFNLKNNIVLSNPDTSLPFLRLGISGVVGGGSSLNAQNDFADDFMFVFDESTKDPTAGLMIENILAAGNTPTVTIGFIDTQIGSIPLWDLRIQNSLFYTFGSTVIVADVAWGLVVENSIIEDSDDGAIFVTGGGKNTGTEIINSKIIDNGGGGAPINTAAIRLIGTNHARIIGNEISTQATGGYAVELVGADYNIIMGNTFDVNTDGQGGIVLDGTSDRNILSNNEFKSLNASGITVRIGASNNVLDGNVMVGVGGTDIVNNGTGTAMYGNYGDEQNSQTDIIPNFIEWNPDNVAARSAIFDGNSVEGLFSINPADDTVRMGDSTGSNYAYFDVDGDFQLVGTADYLVANDDYAWRAGTAESAGMYLDATGLEYEFMNTSGVATSRFGINSGDITTIGEILNSTGTLTLGGVGNTNNENLTFDFESAENTVTMSSSSGATQLNFPIQFSMSDLIGIKFGSSADSRFLWDTTGNDHLDLGLKVGSSAQSGYFMLVEDDDRNDADRSPLATSADPVLRVYSSDDTSATDYLEIYHDQADAIIANGGGDIEIKSASQRLEISPTAASGNTMTLNMKDDGGNNALGIQINTNIDQVSFGLEDSTGNQLVLSNYGVYGLDHDHDLTTNPTLFVHSDLSPNVSNNQWGSLAHDQEDFVITTGDATGAGSAPTTDANSVIIKPQGSTIAEIATTGITARVDLTLADADDSRAHKAGTDPALRVYSADATSATDYLEMYHDQAQSIISSGTGGLLLKTTGGDGFSLQDDGQNTFIFKNNKTLAQLLLGTRDNIGNQFVFTNYDNRSIDHDHALQTDPTLFIHSDTNPDTINTQWGSLSHDKTNLNIEGGSSGHVNTVDATGLVVQVRRKLSNTETQIILVSPDGSCSACEVDNADAFSCASIACP